MSIERIFILHPTRTDLGYTGDREMLCRELVDMVDTAIDCVQRLIELFAARLILGISHEISSTGDMERVRRVGALVEEYNAGVERNARG